MTSLREILEVLHKNKDRLTHKYGINKLAVFGSYSRGLAKEESDKDILVNFNQPIGIEFIDLAEELELLLNNRVDLVSFKGIKPEYFRSIERDLNYVKDLGIRI